MASNMPHWRHPLSAFGMSTTASLVYTEGTTVLQQLQQLCTVIMVVIVLRTHFQLQL